MEERIFGGAVREPADDRDLVFERTLGAGPVMTDEEWQEGYDIEKVLGFKLRSNNQHTSSSCVAQATEKYSSILNFIETKQYIENSAKAIYSQISLGQDGGAFIRDAMNLVVDWGAVYESIVKSYKEDGTTDETFMRDRTWLTEEITKIAKNLQAKEYRSITGLGIDYFARAIKDGYGMVAGVEGCNNGTWYSTYPVPPAVDTPQGKLWGHALYFGKFRIKDGNKFVGALESWGGGIGEDGWQWFGEEWFTNDNRFVFNPWVLIDKPNLDNNMIFRKEKTSPNVYLIDETAKTKMMVSCMEALNALKGSYVEVDSLAEYKDNGTFVWVPYIIN